MSAAEQAARRPARSLLELLAVANLEGVVVVVPWVCLLAVVDGSGPSLVHVALLSTGVWMGYAADRWCDGRRLGPRAVTARHRFAARHSRGLFFVWLAVLGASLALAATRLEPESLRRGSALALVVAAWTAATALAPRVVRRVVPREFAVGLLLGAATAIFAWPDGAWTAARWVALVPFVLLCQLDSLAVAVLERANDESVGEASSVRDWPALERVLDPACGVLGGGALLLAILVGDQRLSLALLAAAGAALAMPAVRRRAVGDHSGLMIDVACAVPALLAVALGVWLEAPAA
ncbi:MAG: hypothetical protein ACYSWX_14625 [Planctomycetota bacterium]